MLWTFIICFLQCILLIIYQKATSLQTHPHYCDFDLSHQDGGEFLIPTETCSSQIHLLGSLRVPEEWYQGNI